MKIDTKIVKEKGICLEKWMIIMKNLGILVVLMLILSSCSLFQKPDNGLCSSKEKKGQVIDTLYTPQIPQHILSLLPDSATNIKILDDYDGYPDDCWIQFTLNKRWFIFGVHYQSSDRFGTCITQILY